MSIHSSRLFFHLVYRKGDRFVAADLSHVGGEPIAADDLATYVNSYCSPCQQCVEFDGRLSQLPVFVSDEGDTGYILVNEDGDPVDSAESAVHADDAVKQYLQRLIDKLSQTEGMLPEQRAYIWSQYMLPRISKLVVEGWEREIAHVGNEGANAEWNETTWASLSLSSRLILVGEPGIGKTSCVRRLLSEAAEGATRTSAIRQIPVYFELRHWDVEASVPQNMRRQLLSENGDSIAASFDDLAESGAVLVCFDGLDEIADQHREIVFNDICSFAATYSEVKILLTARPAVISSLPAGFDFFRLERFTQAQIQEYVLTKLEKHELKESYWSRLTANKDLLELSGNPLLLSLALGRYLRSESSPHYLAEVLRDYIGALVGEWDSIRGIIRSAERWAAPSRKIRALQRLSAHLIETQKQTFSSDDFSILNESFPDATPARLMLLAIESHTGILKQCGSQEWTFSHRAFAEYLASQFWVDSIDEPTGAIRKQYELTGLEKVWNLSSGLTSDASRMIADMVNRENLESALKARRLCLSLRQNLTIQKSVLNSCIAWLVNYFSGVCDKSGVTNIEYHCNAEASEEAPSCFLAVHAIGEGKHVGTELREMIAAIHNMRDGVGRVSMLEQLRHSQDGRLRALVVLLGGTRAFYERESVDAAETCFYLSIDKLMV